MSDPGFHDFYRATLRPLVRHLRRLGLVQEQDLEDVVQEAYAQAYRAWGTLRAREAQVVWLLTIARRQWGRMLARRGRLRLVRGTDEELDELLDGAAPGRSPEDDAVRSGTLAALRAAIDAIAAPKQKQAVELYYLFDWDLPEVSAATGVNPSTLTTWLSRFRERARAALATADDGLDGGKEGIHGRYRHNPR